MAMTLREWLNALAILRSIDEVPGMPPDAPDHPDPKMKAEMDRASIRSRNTRFVYDPVYFLRHADDPTQAAIWAEVERRQASRFEQQPLPGMLSQEVQA